MEFVNKLILGDCEEILKKIPDGSIDLIFTSPPYADQRKHTYGGVHPDEYVNWFLPKTEQFLRVLKPTGTFVLNIKERVVEGERHTYVIELILEMRKQGWFWTEEFMWHKKNSYPGKWPNRFRDNWERLLQFNKSKKFNMYQEAVMVPVGDWAKGRLAKLSQTDQIRDESKVNSGFGKNVSNWIGRDMVYPTNVIHTATECANKNHSAVFPVELPRWFIKLFTQPVSILGCKCTTDSRQHRASKSRQQCTTFTGMRIVKVQCQTPMLKKSFRSFAPPPTNFYGLENES